MGADRIPWRVRTWAKVAGLLAAAALMIDYILTAAVGISAGVEALTSALPRLLPHTLLICLVILAVLAIVNMRGVKDTGAAFMGPTFLFVGTLLIMIGVGVYHTIISGGHPVAVLAPPPALPATVKYLGLWLLMKAFASGCAAMTGVEAVSNGVMAFEEPRSKKAQAALTVIIGILVVLLFGIAYLSRAYHITGDGAGLRTIIRAMVSILTTGRIWARMVLLPDHGGDTAGVAHQRQYCIFRFPAIGASNCRQ